MVPGLFDSGGSFNYSAIEITLNNYQIPPNERLFYFDRVVICLSVISEIRAKRGKSG